MAQGQIYVEVDANSVSGGVMPMAIVSGNPEPIFGQEHYGVWIDGGMMIQQERVVLQEQDGSGRMTIIF